MPETELIQLSGDGSHTMISRLFDNTTYHSRHGAISESNVVFIDAGLNYHLLQEKKQIRVFEMGFGTGLNALLSYIWSKIHQIDISYQTVEAYPINSSVAEQLNYSSILGEKSIFDLLHNLSWDEKHLIRDTFTFQKYHCLIEEVKITDHVDVIYYDAFAPSNQPHLWEVPILSKMYDLLDDGGILVSYCAQGAFKRNLRFCGFQVESIPGPTGKREMTRAIKFSEKL